MGGWTDRARVSHLAGVDPPDLTRHQGWGLEGGHSSWQAIRSPTWVPGTLRPRGTWAHDRAPTLPGLQRLLPAEVSGREPPAVAAPLLLPSPSPAVTVVILTTTSVTRRPWPLGAETLPPARGSSARGEKGPASPPASLPPRSAPHPAGPIHCGGGAGSAGRGAEMGAPPPPPPARALPQDGAGQAAALAVRGQGGPGGCPGRRLGAGGAARAQPAAAGPRRGLRGQRRGPEVRARARGPRVPPGGALLLTLASRTGSAGLHLRSRLQPGKGGWPGSPPRNPHPGARSLCFPPPNSLLLSVACTVGLQVRLGRGEGRKDPDTVPGGSVTPARPWPTEPTLLLVPASASPLQRRAA